MPPPNPVADEQGGFRALIEAVRSRQRQQLWLRGALWGALGAWAVLLLAGLLAELRPGLGPVLLWLAPAVFLAVLLAFGLWLGRRQVGTPERTARLIARRAPKLGLDVLSAIELEHALAAPGPGGFSPELARAFLRDTGARAARVDPATIVDGAPLKRAVQALAGMLVLSLVLLAVSRERLVTGWRVALASSETPAGEPIRREPITGDVELTYRYPDHTGWVPRTVSGTRGDIQAPAGTVVELSSRSDRPVERAGLSIGETFVPLRVEDGRSLSGSFVVERAGSYAFVFQDASGKEVARGPDLTISVEADGAPEVTLRAPEEELEVDPEDVVELRFEARDDFGLSALQLVYRLPGRSEETRVKLPLEDGRRMEGRYSWDTAKLLLAPGDRVTYYIEATDNDAVRGPKTGVSRTQVLERYDASRKRREALARVEQLWGELLELLADRMESADRDHNAESSAILAGRRVDGRGTLLVTTLREVASELADARDVPPELAAALNNVADSTGSRVRATSDFRSVLERVVDRGSGLNRDLRRRLGELVSEEIATEENDILYLEALIDRRKMEELRAMGEQLLQERRSLASRIEELRNAPDEAGREAALQEVQALRRRIQELMHRMSELAKGIRDEHLNAEALQELMSEGDMGSMLDEVEQLLRDGKMDEALAKLQELGMQMEEMLQDFERAEENLGAEQFPELTEAFMRFQEDLQETVATQEKLAKQTRALQDQASAQDRSRIAQKGAAARDALLEKVERITRDYQELPGERLDRQALPSLERAQEALRATREALDAKDYDLAAEASRQAAENAEALQRWGQLQRERDAIFFNPPDAQEETRQLAERLERDAQLAREVHDALSSLFPEPGSQLSASEKQRMEQLAKQQRELQQKAEGLSEQLQAMQQMAPVFDQEAMNQMGQVAQRMGQAGEHLEGQDARRGHGEQRGALEGLERFQQQMQQQGQGKGGRGIPLPLMAGGSPNGRREGNGRGVSQDQVDLPDPDDFESPQAFRKELLDAMKQGAPDRYREQLKRYYEELVR